MVLSSSSLTSDSVRNAQGENLGDLKDLMVDVSNGRVVYAVLDFGGFLGIGNKLFAVPLEAFSVDADDHKLVLDVTKERLENAPGFDQDNWPSTADHTFTDSVYDYYGMESYSSRYAR